MHGRGGAVVDFYRSVTGTGRTEIVEDAKTDRRRRVLRVEQLIEIFTCSSCWRKSAVQSLLRKARKTGAV